MYKGFSILGIIPARGGSKGIKQKNIVKLNGYPLIYYTINISKQTKMFDRLIVSTDSKQIAQISNKYGAETPFIRPKRLSSDHARAIDVIHHAIKWIDRYDKQYDLIYYLQPTSPLRKIDDIKNALNILISKDANSVIGITEIKDNPRISNVVPMDLSLKDFIKKTYINKNRQELKKYYRINGAIYLFRREFIIKSNNIIDNKTYAYIMPKERSIDIDTKFDLDLCKYIMRSED